MKIIYYDKDLADGGRTILREVLVQVAALDPDNWTLEECCTKCWSKIWQRQRLVPCETSRCGATNAGQGLEKVVLWLHIEEPWPEALGEYVAGANPSLPIRAIVVTSMREKQYVHEFPPTLVNGIICVSLGRAGLALLEPQTGEPGILQLWEATAAFENALKHAELFAPEERLLEFIDHRYWRNEQSAALFQIQIMPSIRLLATWWAHRNDSGLSRVVNLRNGLWQDDALIALRKRVEIGTESREARLAEMHRHVFIPLDLQSRWRMAHHQGKTPNRDQRKEDGKAWITQNERELTELFGETFSKTKLKLKKSLLAAAKSWQP